MPISHEEVVWLYRCLLEREPESPEAIDSHAARNSSFAEARSHFKDSDEYRANFVIAPYYRPEVPSVSPIRRQHTLSLASIVKNEAHTIARMLRSSIPVIDHAAIIDTGSTDETKEIAERVLTEAGVKHVITDVPFVDFAQCRNAALDAVPPGIDWTLMLDADEQLVPEDYQRLADLLATDADVIALPRYNFNDADKRLAAEPYPDFQRRLLRTRLGLRFFGRVHERLNGPYSSITAPINTTMIGGSSGGPHIHHFGQVQSHERFWEKHTFYQSLINKE